MARARIELMNSLSHQSPRGRTMERSKPQIITDAAEIRYYQSIAGFDVVMQSEPAVKNRNVPPPPPPDDDDEESGDDGEDGLDSLDSGSDAGAAEELDADGNPVEPPAPPPPPRAPAPAAKKPPAPAPASSSKKGRKEAATPKK